MITSEYFSGKYSITFSTRFRELHSKRVIFDEQHKIPNSIKKSRESFTQQSYIVQSHNETAKTHVTKIQF